MEIAYLDVRLWKRDDYFASQLEKGPIMMVLDPPQCNPAGRCSWVEERLAAAPGARSDRCADDGFTSVRGVDC